MNCKERITDLYTRMGQGQMHEAFEEYYADNVKVVEANGEVRDGKDAQRKGIEEWKSSIKEMHGGGVGSITADEENEVTMVESWTDITFQDGNRMKLEEVGVQKWKDGKIVHERFYYNMPNM